MCIKSYNSRRYCTQCKAITPWKLDRTIGHSRCMVCHGDSRNAKKIKKNVYEEPKMNKQYVKEQIENAISELRKEYDAKIGGIVACPDCGALTFRNSEHVCLGSYQQQEQPAQSPAKRTKLVDYVMDALPTEPPADPLAIFEHNSPYLPIGIEKRVAELGYEGKASSTGPALADLRYADKIKAMAVTIKESGTRNGKRFPRLTTGFAYWRPA